MTNILIIEDDIDTRQHLTQSLQQKNYTVETCEDGEAGLAAALKQKADLILLDLMLPKRDGLSLLKLLRKTSQTPVIMLTAKGAEEERIKGFSHGVDDYVAKPFNMQELLWRIEAILRRCNLTQEHTHHLSLDGLQLERNGSKASANGINLDLTPTQFSLLWTLTLYQGEVLTKPFLSQVVLNKTHGKYDRSLDMHLSRIRRKLLEANWTTERLQSVHGQGYCLK